MTTGRESGSARATLAFRTGEAVDDVGQRREIHRLDTEGDREMTFAGTTLADEVNHLTAVDEVERGQCHDPAALKRRLEREVESRQRLDRRQTRHLQCSLDPAAFANGEFLGKQGLNRLDRRG